MLLGLIEVRLGGGCTAKVHGQHLKLVNGLIERIGDLSDIQRLIELALLDPAVAFCDLRHSKRGFVERRRDSQGVGTTHICCV